jgi:hypothetical protein
MTKSLSQTVRELIQNHANWIVRNAILSSIGILTLSILALYLIEIPVYEDALLSKNSNGYTLTYVDQLDPGSCSSQSETIVLIFADQKQEKYSVQSRKNDADKEVLLLNTLNRNDGLKPGIVYPVKTSTSSISLLRLLGRRTTEI